MKDSMESTLKKLNIRLKKEGLTQDIMLELKQCISNQTDPAISDDPLSITRNSDLIKTINITVLFYEGPIARAYLETMRSLKLKPKKIIHMISSMNLENNKPILSWAPLSLRKTFAQWQQRQMMHYWEQYIEKRHPRLKKRFMDSVTDALCFESYTQYAATSLQPLSVYGDTVESVMVTSLSDPTLAEMLSHESGAILFTGGGLLPSHILSSSDRKFIHIHPGYLPDIRGADGALWSMLIRKRLSATAFYMSPGIDEGDIILPCWLPEVKVDIDVESYDVKTCYRALYAYLDPWIRSYVLRHLLIEYERFDDLLCVKQDKRVGNMFYFMHPVLQKIAMMYFSKFKECSASNN